MTMPDPAHFERHSELYDRARPPYPEELWQRLRTLGLLAPGTQALDLGAGSGQATGTLLSAGMRVTAVEPGPTLAAELQARFPEASVIVNTAEKAVLADAAYDLAVAATSIHWMNLSVVLPKVHRALVPGGHFLVWRNVFGDPRQSTPFRARIAEITSHRTAVRRPGPAETNTDGWVAALEAGGYFRAVAREEFRWSIRLNSDRVRDLFTTFSDWSPAEVAEAEQAVRELGGSVVEHYLSPLIILARVDR